MQRKITVADVRKAIKKNGVGLAQNAYITYEYGDLKALCPLSQLYLAGHPKERDDLDDETIDAWSDHLYGYNYSLGFIAGIDGAKRDEDNQDKRYKEGHAAGVRVRKSLNFQFYFGHRC